MSSGTESKCVCLTAGAVICVSRNRHLTTNTLVQVNLFFLISPLILLTQQVGCLQVSLLMEVLGVTEVSQDSNLTAAAAAACCSPCPLIGADRTTWMGLGRHMEPGPI